MLVQKVKRMLFFLCYSLPPVPRPAKKGALLLIIHLVAGEKSYKNGSLRFWIQFR